MLRGWLRGGRPCCGFSCRTEESVLDGFQPLGPLLPVEPREGADVPLAALHAALPVHLLPDQTVRPGPESRDSWLAAGVVAETRAHGRKRG